MEVDSGKLIDIRYKVVDLMNYMAVEQGTDGQKIFNIIVDINEDLAELMGEKAVVTKKFLSTLDEG